MSGKWAEHHRRSLGISRYLKASQGSISRYLNDPKIQFNLLSLYTHFIVNYTSISIYIYIIYIHGISDTLYAIHAFQTHQYTDFLKVSQGQKARNGSKGARELVSVCLSLYGREVTGGYARLRGCMGANFCHLAALRPAIEILFWDHWETAVLGQMLAGRLREGGYGR